MFARCWRFVFSSPLSHSVFASAFSHFFPLLPLSQKSPMLWKYRSCKVDRLYLLTSINAPDLDLSLFYSQTHFSACLGSMKSQNWSSLAKLVSQMWEQTQISMQEGSSMSLPFESFLSLSLNLPWSAQRNVYLTGFCLFLSLVLTRTFHLSTELIRTQEEHAKLKQVCGFKPLNV